MSGSLSNVDGSIHVESTATTFTADPGVNKLLESVQGSSVFIESEQLIGNK